MLRTTHDRRPLHRSRGPTGPAGSGSVSPHVGLNVGSPDRQLRQSNDLKYLKASTSVRWRRPVQRMLGSVLRAPIAAAETLADLVSSTGSKTKKK